MNLQDRMVWLTVNLSRLDLLLHRDKAIGVKRRWINFVTRFRRCSMRLIYSGEFLQMLTAIENMYSLDDETTVCTLEEG